MSRPRAATTGRLSLRITNPAQERLLRSAAQLHGASLTEFVLAAALREATDTVEQAQRLELRAAAFDAFLQALDNEPAQQLPTLRRYAHPA